jgi:DNA-binding Xre family transcriptional regulator
MMKWRVREVAEAAGIDTAYRLMQDVGLHSDTAYSLWDGTAKRLDLDTLEKLCAFFGVPAGQLIQYVPTEHRGKTRTS